MKRFLILGAALAVLAGPAMAAPIYPAPAGGYAVWYDGAADAFGDTASATVGDNSLDGNWTHRHSSDEWGGNPNATPPQPPFRPADPSDGNNNGGVKSYTEGDTTYLRIVEVLTAGGFFDNRKLGFYYQNLPAALTSPTYQLLDQGCTLHVRWRLPNELVDGLQGPDGKEIDNNGRGLIPLQQRLDLNGDGDTGDVGETLQIGFSLAVAGVDTGAGTPPATVPANCLLMNNLNGNTAKADVDLGEPGTMNYLALDVTQWHEMWITIVADLNGGGGTHRVDVYLDGALTPTTFHVTAGNGAETGASLVDPAAALGMLHNQTSKKGMFDVDFLALAEGVQVPTPEPATLALMGLGLGGLLLRRKR